MKLFKVRDNKLVRELKRIYKETDYRMKRVPAVCINKCYHCCYQPVFVHISEQLVILDYLKNNFSKEALNVFKIILENWFTYFNNNTPTDKPLVSGDVDNFTKQMMQDKVPCLFLRDGECAIYPVRPLACRTYSVNDSSDICKSDPSRNGDEKGREIRSFSHTEIALIAGVEYQQILQYVLTDFFQIENYSKEIKSELFFIRR